jgi:hypothetical protein
MARYRWLQDGNVNGFYFNAGDIAATADAGGTLPVNWVPPAAVDPIDTAAVNAFYNAGPQTFSILIRQQWSTAPVSPPVTYWQQISGGKLWQLTGLGAGLPPIGA